MITYICSVLCTQIRAFHNDIKCGSAFEFLGDVLMYQTTLNKFPLMCFQSVVLPALYFPAQRVVNRLLELHPAPEFRFPPSSLFLSTWP